MQISRGVPRPRHSNACTLTLYRFGLIPFRSPLLWESLLLSFPGANEMFQFTPFTRYGLCIHPPVHGHDPMKVSLFGHPRIKACLAAPRGLSQPATSFFAGRRQGIHRLLLVAWPQNLKVLFQTQPNCQLISLLSLLYSFVSELVLPGASSPLASSMIRRQIALSTGSGFYWWR